MASEQTRKRARAELEESLKKVVEESLKQYADYEQLEEGKLVHEISFVDLFKILRRLEESSNIHGRFLLHVDDKLIELSALQKEVAQLKKDFIEFYEDRGLTCPLKEPLKDIGETLHDHLSDAEKKELVEKTTYTLREQWKQEGKKEEIESFKRTAKLIGLILSGISLFMGMTAWMLGLWSPL